MSLEVSFQVHLAKFQDSERCLTLLLNMTETSNNFQAVSKLLVLT